MALTVTVVERFNFGSVMANLIEVDFDDSYPTGGEAITAADCGMTEITHMLPSVKGGYVLVHDLANAKLMAFYGNYDGSDGPLIEVANETDLNPAINDARLLVLGKV
ncbi:MAG: hypothetical protein AB7G37_06290 [Solirubrobacteraceae bacterium]